MRAFLVCALLAASLPLARAADTDPTITGPGASPAAPKAAPAARPPAGPAQGQAPKGIPLAVPEAPGAKAKRLDDLFAELRKEPAPAKAEAIANRIEAEWADSGSATVDLLMQWGTEAITKKENAAAYDLLDQAILLKPECPEAWNRRATLNYTTDNYGKSLADIDETLRLEPRHYGALLGRSVILEETGRKREALDGYMRILAIYPTLKAAQDAAGRLSEELAGQPA